jgi:anaerobic selenocysteine-containing dehydrogenase
MKVKKVICMQCHNACRLAATVDGDRLISVEPDEAFPGTKSSRPITQGCPRRRNVIEYVYHPARLNYPLKRLGGRGENKWQQITWDEALDEIAAELQSSRISTVPKPWGLRPAPAALMKSSIRAF